MTTPPPPSPSPSSPIGSGDSERRSRLLGIKLRALVGDHIGGIEAEPQHFPSGSALVVDGAAWVLVDGPAARSLGPALAWALRAGATSLHIVADHDTGLLARRAIRFRFPIRVWFAEGRVLLPAVAEPLAVPPAALPEHLELVATIEAAGATPSVEHGVVVGEVRGLEVCRVVAEPTVGHVTEPGDFDPSPLSDADGVLLEVGVGPNDREAFRMLHGDIPTIEALGAVVESVVAYRSADAPQHPLNRLGQERYLRWQLVQEPGRLDMVAVEGAEPPLPRANLKDPVPCVAKATDAQGGNHHVVCSVGVDVDLAGYVADVQAMVDTPVIVALRARDVLPITRETLAQLLDPVEIRTV
jgi:hypothetical protein